MSPERFVLQHGDRWFYYLGGGVSQSPGVLADGKPMSKAENDEFRDGWFFTTGGPAEVIEIRERPYAETVGYRLVEGAEPSDKFPAELTVEEYRERTTDDGEDVYGVPERGLYVAVTEERERPPKVVEGPWLTLDGEPPPDDGHEWTASLPFALSHRAEYRHLFPGYLSGFQPSLKARLEKLPGVQAHDHRPFVVYVEVQWDSPPTVFEKRGRDRTKKAYAARSRKQRVEDLNPPYRIDGRNRADAVARWNAEMERLTGVVQAMTEARLCSCCNATGILDLQGAK